MNKQKTITDFINRKNIIIIAGIIFVLSLIGQGFLFYKIYKMDKAITLNNNNTKSNYKISGKLLNFVCALTNDSQNCGQQWSSFIQEK